MIDLELFESILNNDGGYIEEGDVITEEFIERMRKYPVAQVMRLFKKSTVKEGNKNYNIKFEINLHYFCHKCNKECLDTATKTFVSKILKGEEELICTECKEKQKIELERKMRINEEKLIKSNKKAIVKNTNDYIDIYLDPNRSWNKGVKVWEKMNEIKKINWCDRNTVANHIQNMPYYEFLQTLYWKTIAEKVRISSQFKCKICNSSKHLSVHHRTYEHHGYELDYMEDLVCICQDCHSKFHNIEEE